MDELERKKILALIDELIDSIMAEVQQAAGPLGHGTTPKYLERWTAWAEKRRGWASGLKQIRDELESLPSD